MAVEASASFWSDSLAQTMITAAWSTVLTIAVVVAVLLIARRNGSRLAGAVAGLPTSVAPALVLLACSGSLDYAIHAAVAAMWASAAYATFALCYAHLCRFVPVALSTVLAVATGIAVALLFRAWPFSLNEGLVFALLFCAVVRYFLPQLESTIKPATNVSPSSTRSLTLVAAMAGFVSVSVYALSGLVPPHIVGMFAAAPIVGATVAAFAHRTSGPRAAQGLMAGYVDGCIARIIFCFVFASLLRSHGVAISLIAALTLCVAATVLLYRLSRYSARRSAAATSAAALAVHTHYQHNPHATPTTAFRAYRDITITLTSPIPNRLSS